MGGGGNSGATPGGNAGGPAASPNFPSQPNTVPTSFAPNGFPWSSPLAQPQSANSQTGFGNPFGTAQPPNWQSWLPTSPWWGASQNLATPGGTQPSQQQFPALQGPVFNQNALANKWDPSQGIQYQAGGVPSSGMTLNTPGSPGQPNFSPPTLNDILQLGPKPSGQDTSDLMAASGGGKNFTQGPGFTNWRGQGTPPTPPFSGPAPLAPGQNNMNPWANSQPNGIPLNLPSPVTPVQPPPNPAAPPSTAQPLFNAAAGIPPNLQSGGIANFAITSNILKSLFGGQPPTQDQWGKGGYGAQFGQVAPSASTWQSFINAAQQAGK